MFSTRDRLTTQFCASFFVNKGLNQRAYRVWRSEWILTSVPIFFSKNFKFWLILTINDYSFILKVLQDSACTYTMYVSYVPYEQEAVTHKSDWRLYRNFITRWSVSLLPVTSTGFKLFLSFAFCRLFSV